MNAVKKFFFAFQTGALLMAMQVFPNKNNHQSNFILRQVQHGRHVELRYCQNER